MLSKNTVRCRGEASAGRMTILVQPKTLPLEGDSSLKAHKGKWWVKDSSAIHDIPFAAIETAPIWSDLKQGYPSFLEVSFVNPREEEVLISFDAGALQGQQSEQVGAASTLCVVDELVHASLVEQPYPLRASSRVSSTGEVLTVALGPYEDELLKDVSGAPFVAAAQDPAIDTSTSPNELAPVEELTSKLQVPSAELEPVWKTSVYLNKAVVRIPIVGYPADIPGSSPEVQESRKSYALSLHYSLVFEDCDPVQIALKLVL